MQISQPPLLGLLLHPSTGTAIAQHHKLDISVLLQPCRRINDDLNGLGTADVTSEHHGKSGIHPKYSGHRTTGGNGKTSID